MNPPSHLSMALVGCGQIARAHWYGIQHIATRIRVTACIDIDLTSATELARKTSSRAFLSLEQAIEEGNFDSVNLMLPHDMHESACEIAFEAGKHTILEKPISTDIESAERILLSAKRAGIVFMVAEQAQYWWDIHKARELIESNAIGEVLTAAANFYDPQKI